MIAHVSEERAIAAMWDGTAYVRELRSTYSDLRKGLTELGSWGEPRPIRTTSFARARALSIFACRKKEKEDGNLWHWVVYEPLSAEHGVLYDPARNEPLELPADQLDRRYRPFSSMRVRPAHARKAAPRTKVTRVRAPR